jgi:hypothetical protein
MENIKTIYVHLSPNKLPFANELTNSNFAFDEVPAYTQISIDQTKKITKSDCILLTKNEIDDFKDELLEFFNLCKKGFPSFYKDAFWLTTLLRLYVVYLYVIKHDISSFVHIENDNLIFNDYSVLKNLPEGCFFTKVGPNCGSAGFMFCNSKEKLTTTINALKQLLKKGEINIRPHTSYDFLSEMILIDILIRGNKAEYLPLLPQDKYFELTDCVFDGASYGQYIGGTNNGNDSGWYGLNHFIGQLLNQNKIQILFENNQPFVVDGEKKIKIFNLHIHSKKLSNYV